MFTQNYVIAPLQLITNTYGVPSYGEANPATFAIVTFPFLFAVMFGDYGHGSLLLFAGTMLVLFNEQLQKTAAAPACALRYLFFMMGFFSCYNGCPFFLKFRDADEDANRTFVQKEYERWRSSEPSATQSKALDDFARIERGIIEAEKLGTKDNG